MCASAQVLHGDACFHRKMSIRGLRIPPDVIGCCVDMPMRVPALHTTLPTKRH